MTAETGAACARPRLAFVPLRYYAALLDTLVEAGHDGASILAASNIEPRLLAGEDNYLTLEQVEALVTRACTLENTDDLGLRVGQRLQLMSHGPLSITAFTAPCVRLALGTVVEFFPLLVPLFSVEVHDLGTQIGVRLGVRFQLTPEVERFHTATLSGSLYAQLRFMLGGVVPEGVELSARHPRPPGLPDWVNDTGVALHFDEPHYEIRVPASMLDFSMPLADPRAHELGRQHCRELLAARPDPSRTSSTVARLLLERGPPFPTVEVTARALSLSSRSLRRRLDEEGTSFRSILEEVRLSLADKWLGDAERTITDIGISLGYADASNFSRAYRRSRGRSPAQTRSELGSKGREAPVQGETPPQKLK